MKIRPVIGGLVLAAGAAASTLTAAAPAQAVTPAQPCVEVITVDEADWDVDTGCQLDNGDHIVLNASGQIWAGVWFTGQNGPQGWTNIANDSKFPMPSARAYSLLANTNGNYRYVGTGTSFDYYGAGSRLLLRINDDIAGNGSGSFQVQVNVTHP